MTTKVAATILSAVLLAGLMGATLCGACCPRDEALSIVSPPPCCGDCRSTVDRPPAQISQTTAPSTLDHLQPLAVLAQPLAAVALRPGVRSFAPISSRFDSAPGPLPIPLRL